MLQSEIKKGQKKDFENYRLVSFNWVLGKLFLGTWGTRRWLEAAAMNLPRTDHALPTWLPFVIKLLALEKEEVGCCFLGFSKVFSTVLCSILVAKLERHGLGYMEVLFTTAGLQGGWKTGWTDRLKGQQSVIKVQLAVSFEFYFTQLIIGLILFNIFINDLGIRSVCNLIKFMHDTELEEATHVLGGRVTIQKVLDKLQQWADQNLVQFRKIKREVMHQGWIAVVIPGVWLTG